MTRRLALVFSSGGLLMLTVAACSRMPPIPATSAVLASPSDGATPSTVAGYVSTSVGLPDGLDRFAWSTAQVDVDASGAVVRTRVSGGLLGSPASFTTTIAPSEGYVRTVAADGVVAIATIGPTTSAVDIRNAADGAALGDLALPNLTDDIVTVDPAHSVLYAAVRLDAGGVDIRRVSFDGRTSTTLVTLDKRFTPDGIPTERYGFTLDPDGALLVLACGKADGCRLWRAGPTDASPSPPLALPKKTPIVCSVVGATRDWLVVYDDATCFGDTGDSPTPLRAIDRRDGTSRLLGREHILAGRVIDVGGRVQVLAADRPGDWSTSDIVSIDLATRHRQTLVRGLKNSVDGLSGWLGVSSDPLVEPWVLVAPWGVDSTSLTTTPNARLLNVVTKELIELPPGTFGWN
jgi:hypothetical protein